MNPLKNEIALTPGEPAGIGPDILLLLAAKKSLANMVIFADKDLLKDRVKQLHLNINFSDYDPNKTPENNTLCIRHVPLSAPCIAGQLNVANAPYVLTCLKLATEACLSGELKALVTGPVHKALINEAGIPFSGHTEFLAELTHTASVVMMLANKNLKVALVTTHLPLRKVADAITSENLESSIKILQHDLITKFKIKNPRILVCALNPHAGEGGHLGTEEQTIITPTLEKLRTQGFNLIGPLPADTAFTPQHVKNSDAILAMYHDQGLPVIKAQSFGETVNITLGLPIIRTSVDHGTALELAGTGKADSASLEAAIELAEELAR